MEYKTILDKETKNSIRCLWFLKDYVEFDIWMRQLTRINNKGIVLKKLGFTDSQMYKLVHLSYCIKRSKVKQSAYLECKQFYEEWRNNEQAEIEIG